MGDVQSGVFVQLNGLCQTPLSLYCYPLVQGDVHVCVSVYIDMWTLVVQAVCWHWSYIVVDDTCTLFAFLNTVSVCVCVCVCVCVHVHVTSRKREQIVSVGIVDCVMTSAYIHVCIPFSMILPSRLSI